MKRFYTIVFIIFFISGGFASNIDSKPVGPGIIHHHEFIAGGPWHINILEIDLTNEWVTLETVKANDQLEGNERTSSMCNRIDREANRVVGAVNGDFYASGGIPIGAQIINGELLKRPYPRSAFGYSTDSSPFIDIFSFSGKLFTATNTSLTINRINEERITDNLIMYNDFYSSSTETNYWGTEITGNYISQMNMVNDTVKIVITAKDSIIEIGHGNSAIPANGIVLSAHGTAADFLNTNVFTGDTISYLLQLPPSSKPLKTMIGGMPRIIRNGQKSVEWQQEDIRESFCTDRHPRTAVGFSQDSTKMYFFTVDGRQAGYSVGMSLYELADYMLDWNVYQGVNLDGGGSTTMMVRGNVANSPSDAGGERAVSNALMVISTAPTGETAHLQISPDNAYVLAGNQVHFNAEPLDEFYNPNPINQDTLYTWSCDPTLGSFGGNGLFTAGNDIISGYIYVQSSGIKDSTMIYITALTSLQLKPNPVILKVNESQQMTVEARDNHNNLIALSVDSYNWSLRGGIGQISGSGLFTANVEGQGFIIVQYDEIADSVEVTVGSSTSLIIDPFDNTNNYSLSGSKVDLANCDLSTEAGIYYSTPSSAKLEYSLLTGGTSALYMNCSISVSGSPQSTGIYIYGDGKGHWLRGEFEDVDGEKFLVNFTEEIPGINWNGSWKYLEVPFSQSIPHWANGSAVLTFPIVWKKIYLVETDENKKDTGVIYLDNFTMHYLETGLEEDSQFAIPNQFELLPNYPNPFNPQTTIEYTLPKTSQVQLSVYNMLGQRVQILVNHRQTAGRHLVQWESDQFSSGVYFCRLSCPDHQQTHKMLLVK